MAINNLPTVSENTTLPIRLDPKFVDPPPAIFRDHNNNSITGLNNESLNHTKLHQYRNKEHMITQTIENHIFY